MSDDVETVKKFLVEAQRWGAISCGCGSFRPEGGHTETCVRAAFKRIVAKAARLQEEADEAHRQLFDALGERVRLVQQNSEAVLLVAQLREDVQECVADAAGWRKDAESAWLTIDRLRARNGRLRKAVNWLRGALHDGGGDDIACGVDHRHGVAIDECTVWECQRARDILAEAKDESQYSYAVDPVDEPYYVRNDDEDDGDA